MSAATDLFRARLERRAARLSTDLRAKLLQSWASLREQFTDAELSRRIKAGDLDALLTDTDLAKAFRSVTRALRDGVEAAAEVALRGTVAESSGFAFDVLSPRVVDGIRELETKVMTTLTTDVRETVRAYVENGLRDGVGPESIARQLRSVIGLSPRQLDAVANFRGLLEAGDRGALRRGNRDRRFDASLDAKLGARAPGLKPAQIDKMVEAYQRKTIAQNAVTVTNTAGLDAQRLGQELAWVNAVDAGTVEGEGLTKRWSGTLDSRERPSHLVMEGETVAWDQPFSNGQMRPGDSEYNCRCVAIYTPNSTKKIRPGAGARGIAAEDLRVAARLRTGL